MSFSSSFPVLCLWLPSSFPVLLLAPIAGNPNLLPLALSAVAGEIPTLLMFLRLCPLSQMGTTPLAIGNTLEPLRVADIIRKLTDDRITCDSLPYVRTSSDQSEQRCFSPVINSPRMILGRQEFQDLFLQMERDRNNELRGLKACKSVSKYSHRGRIQALLRVIFLRRGLEARESRQQMENQLIQKD